MVDDKPFLQDNADKQMEDTGKESDDESKERSGNNYDPSHPSPLIHTREQPSSSKPGIFRVTFMGFAHYFV